jgi:RNA polymerase sigma factor (sigma-70 family)
LDLPSLTDEELVLLCRQGRQAAWSVLVRRYQRLVFTVPTRARLPEQVARDVFQITFTRLFESIDRLEQPSRVRAWLVTTARRETLKALQSSDGLPAAAMVDFDEGTARAEGEARAGAAGEPASDPDEEERWHEVRAAVDRLGARCRQLIELLFLHPDELTYEEIGHRLGIPPGSIGPTRGRCLAQLRKLLEL